MKMMMIVHVYIKYWSPWDIMPLCHGIFPMRNLYRCAHLFMYTRVQKRVCVFVCLWECVYQCVYVCVCVCVCPRSGWLGLSPQFSRHPPLLLRSV